MIDHGTVDAALAAYYAQVDAAQSADSQLLAAAQETIDADGVTIGNLTVLVEQLKANQNPGTPAPISFDDFAVVVGGKAQSGWFHNDSYAGGGVTLEMNHNTSTKAKLVPAQSTGSTNPFTIAVVGGTDKVRPVMGKTWSDFIVHGTPQGHLFNGLRAQYMQYCLLHHIMVTGAPGDSGANPGETFGVNLLNVLDSILDSFIVSGKDDTGALVGASNFGLNNCQRIIINRSASHFAKYGTGLTLWKCSNITLNDFDASDNKRAFNVEQPIPTTLDGGALTYNRCNFSGASSAPDLTVNGSLGSVPVRVLEPIKDVWPLTIGVVQDRTVNGKIVKATYPPTDPAHPPATPYPAQTQKLSDIVVIKDGKDVSKDTNWVRMGNVW